VEKDQKLAYAAYRNNVYKSVLPDKSAPRSGRPAAFDIEQELVDPGKGGIGRRL
jgi:hypothetical protein